MTADAEPETFLRAAHTVVEGAAIGRVVARYYALGPVAACDLLRRGFNETYVVRTQDGARYLARLSALRARGEANIRYETALLAHAAGRGARVAQAIPTAAGEHWVMLPLPEGERPLALFEFLPGDYPETPEDAALTGLELARLHQACEGYAGPPSRYQLAADHLLRQPLQWLLEAPTLDAALRNDFTEMAGRLDTLLAAATPDLRLVACHGDCHGTNNFVATLADGTRATAFFDFDDAGPGFLAYDLAVYVWGHLPRNSPSTLDSATADKWRRFLGGYESVARVPDADFAALPLFVCIRHIWLLGEFASRRHHWGSQALPAAWLRKQLVLLGDWLDLQLERQAAPSASEASA